MLGTGKVVTKLGEGKVVTHFVLGKCKLVKQLC